MTLLGVSGPRPRHRRQLAGQRRGTLGRAVADDQLGDPGLAQVALDILADDDLARATREEFAAAGGTFSVAEELG